MSKMYLMTGVSGSGKTTFAKEFAHRNNLRYLSIDNFYCATFGDENVHKHEFDVWMMFYRAIEIASRDNVDIIIDTNSPTVSNRDEIYNWFGHMFAENYMIYIYASSDLCFKNNTNRNRVIPQDEMIKMYKDYECPDEEEALQWTKIYEVFNDNNVFSEMCQLYSWARRGQC